MAEVEQHGLRGSLGEAAQELCVQLPELQTWVLRPLGCAGLALGGNGKGVKMQLQCLGWIRASTGEPGSGPVNWQAWGSTVALRGLGD